MDTKERIFEYDPQLIPYENYIKDRMESYRKKREELLVGVESLRDFANGHNYFGFHKTDGGWYYREWAPGADEVFLTGDMVGWRWTELRLTPIGNGVFEIFLSGRDSLFDGCHVKTVIRRGDELFERIPLYIRRVEQDEQTALWSGVIVDRPPFEWKTAGFTPTQPLCIYECHIGMAQEKEGIGTYTEFCENVLPRIAALGYNCIQIMAIMEHPYYGSFGYQVSSFFAASSRFGTPDELKALIDKAHSLGICVLLDVVHSHAVRNTAEGINEFDGTPYQFFHEGERGEHPAWGTKLFDYGKNEVIHFLLSNLKFWLEEFHFDGFRFDGVTSMIYKNHGLGEAFTGYEKYFSPNTDTEAVTYLQLANELVREVNKNAITVAEDMSAMPGMCLPIEDGGIGFDYRLAMGQPDLWIKLLQDRSDGEWDMWHIWHEITSRRPKEKYVAYVESHDQALVGDKTLMFRLCDSKMYTDMSVSSSDCVIERGMALNKLIRMFTMSAGGEAYLNFMGNEFGHPEWIDFPREGNGWSYFYCRRQWHLADDPALKYGQLQSFDKALISLVLGEGVLESELNCLYIDNGLKVLIYERAGLLFALNFSVDGYYRDYMMRVPQKGKYKVVMSTDRGEFGGLDRISEEYVYTAQKLDDGTYGFPIYIPARTGLCMKPFDPKIKRKK